MALRRRRFDRSDRRVHAPGREVRAAEGSGLRAELQHQPILSCGSIMRTDQAEAFGFPNPILGVAGFAVIVTVGVVLVGGATLPHWFWIGL